MRTVFLFLKRLAVVLCAALIVFSCALSASIAFSEVRIFRREFHFVVILTDKIEVSAGLSALDGGAGYVMKTGDSVALGVYFSLAQAESVKSAASERYERVAVVSVGTEKLYFQSRREKENAEKILAAFSTLYEYLRLVFDECTRLETGGTQESSRRVLRSAARQLTYLGEENERVDEGVSAVCKQASEELLAAVEEIVYARELRSFLCKYAEEYISLAERYRI